jgi:predicted branched-subunit amino acid permease
LTSLAGSIAGAFVGDPKTIGLDFAFSAVFIVLVMGFWKGRETGAVLAASAAAAVLAHQFLPGVWYIAAGAATGVAATLFASQRREACA